MRLPQRTIAHGQIFFHKYWIHHTFRDIDRKLIPAVCLFVSTKLTHPYVTLESLARNQHALYREQGLKINPRLKIPEFLSEQALLTKKTQILGAEFKLLSGINFAIVVNLPYDYIDNFKYKLTGWTPENRDKLIKASYNFVNDSFKSPISIARSAESIAHACLYLASRYIGREIQLDAEVDEECLKYIMELYEKFIT